MLTYVLQGYSSHKAFIIAQTPMRSTANDFWKMILDYKVSGIVACSEDFEEEVSFSLIIIKDVIVQIMVLYCRNGYCMRVVKLVNSL